MTIGVQTSFIHYDGMSSWGCWPSLFDCMIKSLAQARLMCLVACTVLIGVCQGDYEKDEVEEIVYACVGRHIPPEEVAMFCYNMYENIIVAHADGDHGFLIPSGPADVYGFASWPDADATNEPYMNILCMGFEAFSGATEASDRSWVTDIKTRLNSPDPAALEDPPGLFEHKMIAFRFLNSLDGNKIAYVNQRTNVCTILAGFFDYRIDMDELNITPNVTNCDRDLRGIRPGTVIHECTHARSAFATKDQVLLDSEIPNGDVTASNDPLRRTSGGGTKCYTLRMCQLLVEKSNRSVDREGQRLAFTNAASLQRLVTFLYFHAVYPEITFLQDGGIARIRARLGHCESVFDSFRNPSMGRIRDHAQYNEAEDSSRQLFNGGRPPTAEFMRVLHNLNVEKLRAKGWIS